MWPDVAGALWGLRRGGGRGIIPNIARNNLIYGQIQAAEAKARAKGVGLWQEKKPVPPWDWRKR